MAAGVEPGSRVPWRTSEESSVVGEVVVKLLSVPSLLSVKPVEPLLPRTK